METLFIEAVKLINPLQTVLIGLIVFYFYNRLDDKIKDVRGEIKGLRDEIKETRSDNKQMRSDFNNRFDKMNDLIIDLYKTLFKRDVA